MKLTPRRFLSASAAALVLALWVSFAAISQAATLYSYGNFGPVAPGISFLNVTESSISDPGPNPLYGGTPPGPQVLGWTLDFNPKAFGAISSGGGADITDGQLNFTLAGQKVGNTVTAIEKISLSEGGDYTLLGGGTAATKVNGSATIKVKVTEIDGVAITPVSLSNTNASVSFNVASNSGIGQFWGVSLLVDIQSQLTSLGVPFVVGATKAEVVIDNTMTAISEPQNIAFIAKKDFVIGFVPEVGTVVPEPGCVMMAGLALCGIGVAGRRKK